VAWLLMAACLGWMLWRPGTAHGVFLVIPTLLLILVALQMPRQAEFFAPSAGRFWSAIHGTALLLGTGAAVIGCVSGTMYLWQSHRLKHKRPPLYGFRLPSLEWLQQINERSLLISSGLLLCGLVCGLRLNFGAAERADIFQPIHPWTDPVVWTSGLLFAWLVAALLFNLLYRPAREGRKVAYLTVASFIFLGLVLAMALFGPSQHTRGPRTSAAGQHSSCAANHAKGGGV
jgi:hypothetical protein